VSELACGQKGMSINNSTGLKRHQKRKKERVEKEKERTSGNKLKKKVLP
jgi:hypothetical protein